MKKFFYFGVIALTTLILTHSGDVIRNTQAALTMCFEIIIPSLFPFFVCSGLLVYSGFGASLARYAGNIMRPMFNVAPTGAIAFVLGIISGFPTGAICARDLYKSGNLSKIETERLLSFCNNSGPLFIIGSIGTAMYSKPIYGVMLYLIHIASSVVVGVIFRNYGRKHHISPSTHINTHEMSIPETITVSVDCASKNILTVCFSIIFFSAVSQTIFELIPMPSVIDAVFSGLLEFSTGVLKTSVLDENIFKKLVITSFILGFSGLSVHLQVMAVTAQSGLSLKPYILGKCLHGIISAIVTFTVIVSQKVCFFADIPILSFSCFTSASIIIATVLLLLLFISLIKRSKVASDKFV